MSLVKRILQIPLHWQILAALILGGLYGFLLPNEAGYITWAGDLFLRALRMIVAPLILCSIISGVAGLKKNLSGEGQTEGSGLGRLGLKTLLYYALTSLLAIAVGLILVNLVQPGLL